MIELVIKIGFTFLIMGVLVMSIGMIKFDHPVSAYFRWGGIIMSIGGFTVSILAMVWSL